MIRDSYIGVRMPSKMRKALERLAQADHRSLSAYITLALAKHLDQVQAPDPDQQQPAKSQGQR